MGAMTDLEWFDDDSMLQRLLLTELDEPTQTLYKYVHALDYGCSLLRLFVTQERTLLTAEDVAFHLNTQKEMVARDLDALVMFGLVRRSEIAGVIFFGWVADSAKSRLVRELFKWQDRWHARLDRIAHLVGDSSRRANKAVYLQTRDNDSDILMGT